MLIAYAVRVSAHHAGMQTSAMQVVTHHPTSACHVPCVLLLLGLPAVAMLAVQRVVVLPVAGAGLYPVVLQVSSRQVAVLAGAVCLVVTLSGLAVQLVFVEQHTLAAAPRVVLGDG